MLITLNDSKELRDGKLCANNVSIIAQTAIFTSLKMSKFFFAIYVRNELRPNVQDVSIRPLLGLQKKHWIQGNNLRARWSTHLVMKDIRFFPTILFKM